MSTSASVGSPMIAASTARAERRRRRSASFSRTRARSSRARSTATRAVSALDAALVEPRELFAAIRRAIHAFERVERLVEERAVGEQALHRLARLLVIGHALERDPKRGEALRLVAEGVDLERGEPVMQIRLYLCLGLDADAALEDVDQGAGVPELRVDALERGEDIAGVAALLCRFRVSAPAARARSSSFVSATRPRREETISRRRRRLEDRGRALAEHVGVARSQPSLPVSDAMRLMLSWRSRSSGWSWSARSSALLRTAEILLVIFGYLRDRTEGRGGDRPRRSPRAKAQLEGVDRLRIDLRAGEDQE